MKRKMEKFDFSVAQNFDFNLLVTRSNKVVLIANHL